MTEQGTSPVCHPSCPCYPSLSLPSVPTLCLPLPIPPPSLVTRNSKISTPASPKHSGWGRCAAAAEAPPGQDVAEEVVYEIDVSDDPFDSCVHARCCSLKQIPNPNSRALPAFPHDWSHVGNLV